MANFLVSIRFTMLRPVFLSLLLSATLVTFSTTGFGQSTTATIFGSITDNSGAVIPGAQVTATNTATGMARTTTTNSAGDYSMTFVPVGTYRIEASSKGFRTFAQDGVVLEVERNARVDAVLQPGAAEQVITVTSDVPQVNTLDASLGRTVDNKEILNLPLVNRDPYSFLTLTPGVSSSTNSNALGYPQQQVLVNGSSQDRLSGNLGGSVGFYIDGGFNNQGLRGTGNVAPNPDAVQEFRVVTNSYSAEYGRYSGAVVNLITKSGTNSLHGSLFEFLRNDKLNAAPWNVPSKPPLHRNQFGGSIGGPIVKNHTFFFGSYSGLRQHQTTLPPKATVPTDLERQGNFSASSVKPINPATSTRYPGDIVPIDPVSQKILDNYIPRANLANNQYQALLPNPFNSDEYTVKIDHTLTSAHQLSGSYFLSYGNTIEAISGSGAGNIPWSQRTFNWKQQNYAVSDTWAVNASAVNELRLNYVRNFGGRLNLPGTSLADLGSKYTVQGPPSLPRITVNGFFTLGEAISGPIAGSNYYGLRDTLALSRGRHSLKIGGEVSLEKMVQNTTLDNYGTFTFDGSKTRGTQTSGNALADFLAGLPVRMTQDAPVNKEDNDWYYALFVQDDFRIHPRFTLNLGIRWDVQPPTTDPHDRKLTYVPGAQSNVVPTAPAGLLFIGDQGITRGIIETRMNHVAPRVGFAWDPFGDGKTSIRSGFGMYWNSISGNEWNQSADRLPFSVRQTFNVVKSLSDPYGSVTGGSPFPYVYSPSNPKFILPAAVAGPDLNFQWPYTYQMNFSIQRQLTGTMSVTAAYVGSLNHNLAFVQDINYPLLTANASTNNVDSRRPILPGTLSSIFIEKSLGKDIYHSLQLSVDKRISHNFSFKGFYVYSKDIESIGSDAQNMTNLAAERARSDNDRRHSLVFSTIWDLSYLPKENKLGYVLNGWNISTITTLQSGAPLTVTTGSDRNLDGSGNDRPNVIGDIRLDPNRGRSVVINQWFNTAAFVASPLRTDGNAGRNILDGPGSKNVDLAIFRNFGIKERTNLQFRAEMTNAFNFVNLRNPNGTLSSPQFGKITSARDPRQMQLGLRLAF
jgi:hypothetical protein